MNSAIVRTAIASMVLGTVSVSLYVPIILFSFFRWSPGMLIVFISLTCGALVIVMGVRTKVLRPVGRAIVGLVLGIIGTSISELLLLCLSLLYIAF